MKFQPWQWLFFLQIFHLRCYADVGTAASYSPPYLPTDCNGDDASQFPSSNLFAAAGDGIWDNGASCGRQYLVRCISATAAGTCNPEQTIQVKIVDYAISLPSQPTAPSTTMVLSDTAFSAIANPSARSINIEFQQTEQCGNIWIVFIILYVSVLRIEEELTWRIITC